MKKLLSVAFIAILLLMMMPSVVTAPAEAAAKKLTITWNYNGGKIGKDIKTTTTVKKGAKIGKLPKTPAYTGYTFKGWYTKKTGGTKVTVSTKPTKDVTYYAQWKNGNTTPAPTVKPTPTPTPVPTSIVTPITGAWVYGVTKAIYWPYEEWTKINFLYGTAVGLYQFRADGTYKYQFRSSNNYSDTYIQHQGKYRVEGNKIVVFERTENYIDFDYPNDSYENKPLGERTYYYQFTQTDDEEEAIYIENTAQDLVSAKWKWQKVK